MRTRIRPNATRLRAPIVPTPLPEPSTGSIRRATGRDRPAGLAARLDEAICHRLLGDYRAARERLDALVAGPPTHVLLRAGR